MASFNENDKRDVLPNWRSYNKTSCIGEFDSSTNTLFSVPFFSLDEYVYAWKEHREIPFAADLVSAAITNGQCSNPEVIEAASFIINHPDDSSNTQLLCAKKILPKANAKDKKGNLEIESKLSFLKDKETHYKESIRILKQQNIKYPYNAINYCELARYYANLGQPYKAKEMMEIAVHLAPSSRFISRSAARLFSHIGDLDRAHKVLVNNPWISKDPWIIASEIAVNSVRGRNSRFIKRGKEIISSGNYHPFSYSEMASAIGTLEMQNGSKRACRNYMNIALERPNDNSLAQAEWILSENKDLSLHFGDYDYLKNKAEADCRYAYFKDNFTAALSSGIDWIADYPFDPNPIYFSAEMAYTFVKDYKTAIEIIELGLRANPNDAGLLNNLAYCYALLGNVEKAEAILNKVDLKTMSLSNETRICLIATRGLVEYRKGHIESGHILYYKAITDAKEFGCERNFIEKAMLNYIREEVRANPTYDRGLLSLIDDIEIVDKEAKQLKIDIITNIHNT